MQENYMSTSTGVKNKKPYATLNCIVSGTKENGDRYSFLDDNRRVREEEEIAVGTIIQYETKRVVAAGNMKINAAQ
jgi:hypothetical protein